MSRTGQSGFHESRLFRLENTNKGLWKLICDRDHTYKERTPHTLEARLACVKVLIRAGTRHKCF
jgi:hypothetical protein